MLQVAQADPSLASHLAHCEVAVAVEDDDPPRGFEYFLNALSTLS
jgi:hypothetical protein